jgi:hypothetical protein
MAEKHSQVILASNANLQKIIGIIGKRLYRNLSPDETTAITRFYNKVPDNYKIYTDNIATQILETLFISEITEIVRGYMKDNLREDDNPTYFTQTKEENTREGVDLSDPMMTQNTTMALMKLTDVIENVFLFPNYIRSYVVLDSKNLPYPILSWNFITPTLDFPVEGRMKTVFSWPLSALNESTNDYTIILKYPLSNIIRIQVLPFTLPCYYVWGGGWYIQFNPPNKEIQIQVSEIVEKFSTSRAENYTIPATMIWDESTYDGTNLPFYSNVTPKNNGEITFRYDLKSITNLTFSFNDYHLPMIFPQVVLKGYLMFKGNPTRFKVLDDGIPQGHLIQNGDRVVIENMTTTDPVADVNYVAQITRQDGWVGTVNIFGAYTILIDYDTTAMVGDVLTYNVYVPSRRLLIPMVITQLRPGEHDYS